VWGDFYPSLTCEQFVVNCDSTPLTNYCFIVQGKLYAIAGVISCTDNANGITFAFDQSFDGCTYGMNLFPPSAGGNPYDPTQLTTLANLFGYSTATPATSSSSTDWPACATSYSDYYYIGATSNVAGFYSTTISGSTMTVINSVAFSN
jgi:hypothetical protein